MGKYDAWSPIFLDRDDAPFSLSFDELASLIPGGLPPSAYKYQAWWASPQQHAVWRRHGWRASPDFNSRTVQFIRTGIPADEARVQLQPASLETDRLMLVGCVATKLKNAAPAKDLYISPLWEKRKSYAEASGMPWAILSAEYGLIDPDEVIEPYDRYMGNQPLAYRRAWSERVAEDVVAKVRELGIDAVEIHAGSEYVKNGLIEALDAQNVQVFWPVRGLRFGEHLAFYSSKDIASEPESEAFDASESFDWLRPYRTEALELAAALRDLADRIENEVRGRVEAGEASIPLQPTREEDKERIVQWLLAHAESLGNVGEESAGNQLTPDPAANDFVSSDPFAFLIAVIADYQITAERAWALPWELKRRLGHLDAQLMMEDPEALYDAFQQPPMLHRFIRNVPAYILDACRVVLTDYEGDAGAIWGDEPTARELQDRLNRFPGISQKKAAMAVEILERDLGVAIGEMEGSDLAFDVHVRRVMLRTGLADRDDQQHMINRARELNPTRPGALDNPMWHIGRTWCHPGIPDCPNCVLADVCPKLIDKATGVLGA